MLLFTVSISLMVVTASVMIIAANSLSVSHVESGSLAYHIAESGLEDALMRLLRDPAAAEGTLTVGLGQATVIVTGSDPLVVTSTGRLGNFVRSVRADVSYTGGIMTVSSWQEVFN